MSRLSTWALLLLLSLTLTANGVAQEPGQVSLAGELELARLVDLCARRLGLNLEYDANELKGSVTLRLEGSLTDPELWSLTNQILAARGFVTVRRDDAGSLAVVRVEKAAGLAPVEREPFHEISAGFRTVVIRPLHRSADDLTESIKLVLSSAGNVQASPDGEFILISDLAPRIDDALWVVEQLDVPARAPHIEKIAAQHLDASALAAIASAAATARDALLAQPLPGQLLPVPDGSAVVLIAPPDDVETWKALLRRFDERESVETRTYLPTHFPVAQVQQLIEQTARDTGPRGSGDRWRIVADELTGTLIITATATEHTIIEALIQRLESAPVEARRPVRAFPIRNRSVGEILNVLADLIEAGVLEAGEYESAPMGIDPIRRQQTQRDVLPPGATPILREPEGVGAMDAGGSGSVLAPSATASYQAPLTLTADEGTNTLIAVGDARRLAQLEELLETLDVRQPQVMIEVLVVSLTDADTLDLGVELEKLEISGSTIISLSSLFGLGTVGIDMAESPTGSGFTGLVLNPGDFRILIRALETLNDGRALNIPKVLVNNNQQAILDSVLQAPFASTNASNTVATTSFGGTQDAGTTVTVKPQIAAGDHLILEYSVSLSTFVGESSTPELPPPRLQSTLQSLVTIPDGYTVVLGGLEIVTEAEATSQIPLLGDIPFLGELFKSRSKSRSRSRFYVFIRADVYRHNGFEDLKFVSDMDTSGAGVDNGWPDVEPRLIR